MTLPISFCPKPPAFERFVFIDGISRSGKKLACRVVSALEKADHFQHIPAIENMLYLNYLGSVDADAAGSFVAVTAEENGYNRSVGRNLNTRKSDQSSILRAVDTDMYMARETGPEGQEAVDKFNAEGRIHTFHTHGTMIVASTALAAMPGLKYIQILRNPVDIAEDWLRRGWGSRHGKDPLSFRFLLEKKGRGVPWFAFGWEERYLALNPAERCIECVLRLYELARQGLSEMKPDHRDRVVQIAFEHLVSNPTSAVQTLSDFLETQPDASMPELLATENCPRTIPRSLRSSKLEKLAETASPEIIERLLTVSKEYEGEWGLDDIEKT